MGTGRNGGRERELRRGMHVASSLDGRRVTIVEDNPRVARSIAAVLHRAGATVVINRRSMAPKTPQSVQARDVASANGISESDPRARVTVDLDAAVVSGPEGRRSLTPTQVGLLRALVPRSDAWIKASTVAERVFHRSDEYSLHLVAQHVLNLRRRFSLVGAAATAIESRWGVGYRIVRGSVDFVGPAPDGTEGSPDPKNR